MVGGRMGGLMGGLVGGLVGRLVGGVVVGWACVCWYQCTGRYPGYLPILPLYYYLSGPYYPYYTTTLPYHATPTIIHYYTIPYHDIPTTLLA